MFKFSEFKSCVKDAPKKPGEYLVICIYNKTEISHISNIEFTPEYGWNTSLTSTKYSIDYSRDANFEYFWSELPEVINER